MCYLHEVQQGQMVRRVLGHHGLPKSKHQQNGSVYTLAWGIHYDCEILDIRIDLREVQELQPFQWSHGVPSCLSLQPLQPHPCLHVDQRDPACTETRTISLLMNYSKMNSWITDENEKVILGHHEHRQDRKHQRDQRDPGRKWENKQTNRKILNIHRIMLWDNSA